MAQPYIGEIRMFAGNFAPMGWMFCDGQLLPIVEYDTLFALIGTTFGGDGQETFQLPDLRSRVPIHQGQSTLGTTYALAEAAGVEEVTLSSQQMPAHNHAILASNDVANSPNPAGNVLARSGQVKAFINGAPSVAMAPQFLSPSGGSQPHTNIQPYLCVNFIISLFGIFPQQS